MPIFFIIVENENLEKIIIGNEDMKIMSSEAKKIPIEGRITTKKEHPISWSRPIRNYQDKKDFKEMLENLFKLKIVEPGTSSWLNPVVLIRKKKTNALRFCIDFR